MVGAGYLWTGDYFKYRRGFATQADAAAAGPAISAGAPPGAYQALVSGWETDVDDVYMITNKLTLSF